MSATLLNMKCGLICTALVLLQAMLALRAQSPVPDQKKAQAVLHFEVSQIGKDCSDAKTTVEENSCIVTIEQKTRDDFASFYGSLRSLLQEDTTAVSQLQASQEQWEQYVQKACDAIDHFFRNGTIRLSAVTGCKIRLTRSRMQDLNALYYATLNH